VQSRVKTHLYFAKINWFAAPSGTRKMVNIKLTKFVYTARESWANTLASKMSLVYFMLKNTA